jgi:hypothetical protein
MDNNSSNITGIDIPFGDLIILLVKLALAAIPAGILLALIGSLVALPIILLFK